MLDKTGTVTEGSPAVTRVITTDHWHEDQLLRLAASVEAGSEHPLAEAIVASAQDRKLEMPTAEGFEAIAGHGVQAQVEGQRVLFGNQKLMERNQVGLGELIQQAAELASKAQTPMYLAVDGRAAGIIAVADPIKSDSSQAIEPGRVQ